MRKLFLILVIFLGLLGYSYAATYYIDYDGGADTNNGTAKETPWKHAPGMIGCSDNCAEYKTTYSDSANTYGAGNSFIFKGGVTWPNDVFVWDWTYGGGTGWTIGTNAIYFGVDATWYTGASWSRPIFDAEGEAVTTNTEHSISHTMLRLYKASGGYFIVDNLEFKGAAHLDNTEYFILNLQNPYSEVKNSYFHGWSHGGTATSDNLRVIYTTTENSMRPNIFIHDNVIDGSDSSPTPGDMAHAIKGHMGHVYKNYIGMVQNGQTNGTVYYMWGNTFYKVAYETCFDATAHHNTYQAETLQADTYIYNNYIESSAGGATILLYPTTNEKSYIFNNVIVDDGNQTFQLSSKYLEAENTAAFHTWNNTVQLNSGVSYNPITGSAVATGYPAAGNYTVKNNHFIATTKSGYYGVNTPTETTNLWQTNAEATTASYVYAGTYPYTPPEGGGTIDGGTDLSTFCDTLTDTSPSSPKEACKKDAALGVVYDDTSHTVTYPKRASITRSTWDIGAYEYGDTIPSYTVTPSTSGSGGSISPAVAEAVASGDNSSTYTATPYNGWKHVWGGDAVSCGTASTCQLTNVTGNKSVSVTFSQIQIFP